MTVVGVLMSVIAIGASGVATWNALRQYRDVRRVIADRRERCPGVGTDPLAIFTPEEVAALTTSPSKSWVRGTRLFRRQCPDPWAKDFQVADHLWAVYANRLREMVRAGTVAVEVVIVLSGGLLGVFLTRLTDEPAAGTGDPVVMISVTLLVVAFAAMVRVTLLREWQTAADRYRELAIGNVRERLAAAERTSV